MPVCLMKSNCYSLKNSSLTSLDLKLWNLIFLCPHWKIFAITIFLFVFPLLQTGNKTGEKKNNMCWWSNNDCLIIQILIISVPPIPKYFLLVFVQIVLSKLNSQIAMDHDRRHLKAAKVKYCFHPVIERIFFWWSFNIKGFWSASE